jgi:hypothetical protein
MQSSDGNSILKAPHELMRVLGVVPPFSLFLPDLGKSLELIVYLWDRIGDNGNFGHFASRKEVALTQKSSS